MPHVSFVTFSGVRIKESELLERGEREVVLEYFARCAKFWQHGSDQLAEWIRQGRAGEMPAFGANLRY